MPERGYMSTRAYFVAVPLSFHTALSNLRGVAMDTLLSATQSRMSCCLQAKARKAEGKRKLDDLQKDIDALDSISGDDVAAETKAVESLLQVTPAPLPLHLCTSSSELTIAATNCGRAAIAQMQTHDQLLA